MRPTPTARLQPQCACLILNANGDPARFAETKLTVIPDTPTAQLPVQAGDLCVRINGEPVAKWGYDRYAALLKSAAKVTYTFLAGTTETDPRGAMGLGGGLVMDNGGSLSLMTGDATAVRVDFGFGGGEGAHVFFSIGPIFAQ